jgi:hypothetical protein
MNCKDAGSRTVRWALSAALITSCSMLFLSACATMQRERDAQSARFEFGLIGDVPYDGRAEREFAHVMKGLDAADLSFVVHNGDFWWDGAAWTEQAGGPSTFAACWWGTGNSSGRIRWQPSALFERS